MNVIDDQFFQKVAEDKEVCKELLQILLDKPDLEIIEANTQRKLPNLQARAVILDALCKDANGNLFNIEVQKDDKKRDHSKAEEYQKRVRFNLASMDTAFAEKGIEFHKLPDLYAIFISQIDPFGEHKASYRVRRALEQSNTTVYNGISEIYVNTASKDGTLVAELMQYFENSNGINPKFEKLSYRVEHFKNDENEVTTMASVFDEYAQERVAEQAKEAAYKLCNFPSTEKPVLLIIGGSTGSKAINEAVRKILPKLLAQFHVIHLCGKGNLDPQLNGVLGYAQFEYVSKELTDMFALADLAISRAGANAICELVALRKPNILIPLSAAASRGDQILNAKSFEKQGFSYVIFEEDVTDTLLLDTVQKVYQNRQTFVDAMARSGQMDSIRTIVDLIKSESK
jgi:predicted transposase/invertase (TIGR01784 family)